MMIWLDAVRIKDKHTRDEASDAVKAATLEHFAEIFPEQGKDVSDAFDKLKKNIVRRLITIDKIRPDGRAMNEVRPLSCEVDILKRTHGSALFTRGQTQILSVVTLGSSSDEQMLDGLEMETRKRYIHQYNFPPYSVGECKPMRGPGRREIATVL